MTASVSGALSTLLIWRAFDDRTSCWRQHGNRRSRQHEDSTAAMPPWLGGSAGLSAVPCCLD